MTVIVDLNGVGVPVHLDDRALDAIAEAVTLTARSVQPSPYLTITEAAVYLRCKRQRIDDLLSSGRLKRYRDGRRVLVARDEIDSHLDSRCPIASRLPRAQQARVTPGVAG